MKKVIDDVTDAEWKIIEERAARHDLVSDDEVEQVFSRFRSTRKKSERGRLRSD